MSNQNTVVGVYNLPAQSITSGTETALLVPAQGAYPGYPSPTLAAGAGLFLAVPQDITGAGSCVDGHELKIRIVGKVAVASGTFQVKLYQVPAAISAAGTQATLTNDNVVFAPASQTPAATPNNFWVDFYMLWDSGSQLLNGYGSDAIGNLPSPPVFALGTQRTVTTISGLQFIPSFTFGTGNAANSVTITEFTIERR